MASSNPTSSLVHSNKKLVLQFLKRTSDDLPQPQQQNESAADKKASQRKRKRKELAHALAQRPANQNEIVERHIKTMMALDRTMAAPPTKKKRGQEHPLLKQALERLTKEQKQDSQRRSKAKQHIVGNSRSHAVQSRIQHPPTFNKKQHAKQLEEQSLQEIAKLLKKHKRQQQKKRDNNDS